MKTLTIVCLSGTICLSALGVLSAPAFANDPIVLQEVKHDVSPPLRRWLTQRRQAPRPPSTKLRSRNLPEEVSPVRCRTQ
jgi:hypothetical protein